MASLSAGELDRRILIVPAGPPAQDAAGEPIAGDDVGERVWAKLVSQRAGEVVTGASDQVSEQLVLRIRRREVDETSLVVYPAAAGARYEITGIQEYGRGVGLDLTCQRLGSNV
jgi:head-tail adaptor